MKRKPIIISISSTSLTSLEKRVIKQCKPWGIILFKRNIKSLKQVINLVKTIKFIMRDKKYPILIDEEGGRVTRLSNIIQNSNYSQSFFGKLFNSNRSVASSIYQNYINSVSNILKIIGVNINTVPVADLFFNKAHKIIGDRSFSSKVLDIQTLSSNCVSAYKKNKIATVIKHIPGHGRSKVDSHKRLPTVVTSYKTLINEDFKCFKKTKSLFAMTAHILYSKLDSKNVATHSKIIIKDIIRKKIRFKGLLISDDISMKALKYNIYENSRRALKAGCNLVLYCKGNTKISEKLLRDSPYIDTFTKKKTSEFYKFLS